MTEIIKKFKRGDIWRFNPDPTIGREQAKTRPCLIVSSNQLNSGSSDLLLILPLTSTNRGIPSHIFTDAKGLKNASFIMCEQVRSISKKRIVDEYRIAVVDSYTLRKVEYWLSLFLDFEPISDIPNFKEYRKEFKSIKNEDPLA